jgi:hypothetical protein
MRERSGQILRIACVVLGALLVMQFVVSSLTSILGRLRIPDLPTLSVAAEDSPAGKGTNAASAVDALKKNTNLVSRGLPLRISPVAQAGAKDNTNSGGKTASKRSHKPPQANQSSKVGTDKASETEPRTLDTNHYAVETGTNLVQGATNDSPKPAPRMAARRCGIERHGARRTWPRRIKFPRRSRTRQSAISPARLREPGGKEWDQVSPPGPMAME